MLTHKPLVASPNLALGTEQTRQLAGFCFYQSWSRVSHVETFDLQGGSLTLLNSTFNDTKRFPYLLSLKSQFRSIGSKFDHIAGNQRMGLGR